jgi:hypothetical protein
MIILIFMYTSGGKAESLDGFESPLSAQGNPSSGYPLRSPGPKASPAMTGTSAGKPNASIKTPKGCESLPFVFCFRKNDLYFRKRGPGTADPARDGDSCGFEQVTKNAGAHSIIEKGLRMRTTFRTTKEMLDHLAALHGSLSDFYRNLKDKTDKSRVKLLLGYVGNQRERLQKNIKQYETEGSDRALNTWFQYANEVAGLDQKARPDIGIHSSVEDVLNETMKVHDTLYDFYRTIAGRTGVPAVREVFSKFMNKEKEEKKKLIRDLQYFQDV